MKNFKFCTGFSLLPALSALSLALLFSVNSPVVASVVAPEDITCDCCYGDCWTCAKSEYIYSQDNNFRVGRSKSDYDSIIVERVAWGLRCVSSKQGCPGIMERVSYPEKTIFEFKNLVSFSFSKDSKYLLVERAEYSTKFNAQNDFLEIFDLVNEKRILFMPFIKKCCPSKNVYAPRDYSVAVGDFNLNFSERILISIDWRSAAYVPASLFDVKSVYMSPVALAASVKFNDGTIKVYLPKKDFSGLNILATFDNNFLVGC